MHAVVARSAFGSLDVVLRGRRQGLGTCQKRAKREGFAAVANRMAGMGPLKRICNDACRMVVPACSSNGLRV